jgi:hypothetical protein
MPASVEVFEIVPVVNGIGASKVTIRRSDLEQLEFAADNATLLRDRVTITDAGPVPSYAVGDEGLYPKFRWSLKPALRISEPLKGDVGLRLSASYDIRPGLVLRRGLCPAVRQRRPYRRPVHLGLAACSHRWCALCQVRRSRLEKLTLAWYARPAPDFYSRVTVGYLERMHAGCRAKSCGSPWKAAWPWGQS